jgi:hypothetical protein
MYKIVCSPTDSCSRVLSLITPITQSYSVKLERFEDYHPLNIFYLSIPNILVMVLFWHILNLEKMSQKIYITLNFLGENPAPFVVIIR